MTRATLLYRDRHLVALDKPPGMASVRERWTDDESALVVVWKLLRETEPGAKKPIVVHRIDKETSGVLLFATSREAAKAMSRGFREREIEKTYLALVKGTPPEETGTIELDLGDDPSRPGFTKVVGRRGRRSVTGWRRAEPFRGYSLLEVRPRTGRTHQVRVSLAHLGYPLLVDPAYGGDGSLLLSRLKPGYKRKREKPERPILSRLSLHAQRIRFPHPIGGDDVEIVSPVPKDFALALKYLRKYRALRRGS